MLNRKQLVKRSLHFVLSVNLVFVTLAPAFSTPVFASTETAENKQTTVISKEVSNIAPVDRPIDIEPAPESELQPIDIGQIKPVEIIPEKIVPDIRASKEKPVDQPLLDAEGVTPLDMYDNRDNAGKKPSDQVGQYNVDEFTGLFSYSYPLQIPAGRNNLQPTVNLQYNHRQQNLGSFVGFGWELNMPSIQRDNRTGIDKLYTDNYFRLNLNGNDILEPINVDANGYGLYGKKVESDFLKIEFASSSNSWLVTDKLGTVYTFGVTTASRQDNPNDNTQVYQWMLEEIRDTNDNFVRYEYYKDAGQIYPKKIFYTGHGTTDGIFEVDFEPFANGTPTENNLLSISEQTGFAVQTKYLLDSVDIKINNQIVTSYQLDLQVNEKGNKFLLKKIIPTFYQESQEFVKDEASFVYSQEDTAYRIADNGLFDLPNNYTLGGILPTFDNKRDMFVDLDADGLSDYIRMYCANGSLSVNVWENNGLGGWATSTYSQFIGTGFSCSRMYGAVHSIPVSFANLNGDALIDMVTDNLFYINTGSGWQTEIGALPVSLVQDSSNGQPPMNTVMFQDMNNDGYDDIVYEFHPNNNTSNIEVYIKNSITNTWILNNNYDLSVDLEISDCLIYGGDPYAFVDYNNDGLLDVFYNFNCSFFQYNPPIGAAAYLNNGDGFVLTTDYIPLEIVSYFIASSPEQHVSYFSDLNFDGIFDTGHYSRGKWYDPNGYKSSGQLSLFGDAIFDTGTLSDVYFNQLLPIAITDLNGDQKQDVIHSWGLTSDVYLAQGEKSDILKQIDYQSGSKLYINYDFSTREKDQNNNLLNPDLPFNLYVVKEVVVDNDAQQYQGYQYEYSDGKTINYPTEKIKDTYGFAKVAKKVGQARPNVDLGDGADGAFVSSDNETWATNKNFTSLHIQSDHIITVEPNVVIKVIGDVTINGVLNAKGKGYPGGQQVAWGGQLGFGPGGGGAGYGGIFLTSTFGAGGAGHSTIGSNGQGCAPGYCTGGGIYGGEFLDAIDKGSGGGGSGDILPAYGSRGGAGGGIIQLFANNITVNGEINVDGNDGENGEAIAGRYAGGAGGGSGGSIYIKSVNNAFLGNNLVHSHGGIGGIGGYFNNGGDGADGRIRIEAKNITGQTEPAYFSEGKFTYSIDNAVNDESLQKQINYYHTAKDDDLFLHGKIKKLEKYDADDNLINKSFVTWQEEALNSNQKFVYSPEKSSINFSSSTVAFATQSDYDLTNGNLLSENNLGQVGLDTNTGEILDILAGDEKTTTYEYAQNTTKHILSAPKEKVITDTTDTKAQELYYDDLAFGQVNKVNLTKEDYLVDNVEINRQFNNLGLVVAETDPENNVSEIVYDEHDLYPSETVNAVNQTTYTNYNLLNSQVATSTAVNGAVTVNSFDAFGRLVKTQISSPSSTTELLTKQEIVYQDFDFPRYREEKDYFDINQYKIQREYYDGLDRVIQTKSQTASPNQWATQDISYDSLGRVARQSLPYISQNIDYSVPDLQQVAKTYTYDALNRVLIETTPVGTTTYSYNGLSTSIYDANSHRKDLTKDAYGNLVQVKEYNGQDVYITNYEYTLTNKLSKITDALGNIRNFVYDDLDNLVSQDMIHRPDAQSIPSMTYTYDKNGNVLSQTNFNNQTISYTYDDLNRVLTESVNGSIKTTYTYDQGSNNIGKLTYINYNHNGNWQSYNYNLLNQLTDYDVRIHGDDYAMNYSYNLDSNLKQIDYPNNKQANYNFNNIGQVSSVSVATSTIASNLQYNVNGQLTHLERANGLITDYSYTPSQAYRLTNLSTTNATSTLQDISYTYDAVGNILNITDNANTDLAKSATYFYDDLNRLASTTVSYVNIPNSNYNQNFSYDAIGNILTNSSVGSYNYTLANPQQLSSVPNQNFTYDNAGNLTNDENKTLTWDWRSRMIKSQNTGSQNISNYTYDANNQRLMKQTQEPLDIILGLKNGPVSLSGGGNPPPPAQYITIAEEHYVDQYFERDDKTNDTKDHVFINGQKIATINNNNAPYYIISDHLNSSSILVDNAGNIAEVSDYRPFGSEVYSQTITDLKNDYNFTGKETDEESTLQYFGARYMDNNIGRFVSVDPNGLEVDKLVKFINDPQLLNSYSYSKNNPIVFNDPDGRFPFLVILGIVAVGVLLDNIHAAQAPTSASDINYTPKVKEFADLSVPGYEGLPSSVKFTAGLALGGATSKIDQAAGKIFIKGIDRWMAKEAVSTAERASVKALWANTTFKSTEEAILYHYDKHVVQEGIEKSVYNYTLDARKFWGTNSKFIGDLDNMPSNINIKSGIDLGNGTKGFKIKDYSSGHGGIYTNEGSAVSFFYN